MEKSIQIGKNIKSKREEKRMFQAELADKLGVSPQTVSSWEIGRTEPKYYMLERMAKIFDCSPYDLAGVVQPDYVVGDKIVVEGVITEDEREFIEMYRKASQTARLKAYAELLRGTL